MREHTPLIITEIVNDNQEYFLLLVEQREDRLLEQFRTDHRTFLGGDKTIILIHPVEVMSLDEFPKAIISLGLLHLEHLRHATVGAAQLQFPVNQSFVHVHPIIPSTTVVYLHADLHEVLLITALRHLTLYLPAVDILLKRQKDLVGVDGLDEIVGDL